MAMKLFQPKPLGPKLKALIESGVVTVVDVEYVGRCPDGSDLVLGCLGSEDAIEEYDLDPKTW